MIEFYYQSDVMNRVMEDLKNPHNLEDNYKFLMYSCAFSKDQNINTELAKGEFFNPKFYTIFLSQYYYYATAQEDAMGIKTSV